MNQNSIHNEDSRVNRIVEQDEGCIGPGTCLHVEGVFAIGNVFMGKDGDIIDKLITSVKKVGVVPYRRAVEGEVNIGKCRFGPNIENIDCSP